MVSLPSAERRKHKREPLSAGVTICHDSQRREFPARGVDVSAGGMLMLVPMTMPIAPGRRITVKLGELAADSAFAHYAHVELPARVVRVGRASLTTTGQVSVGVQFDVPLTTGC